MSLLHFSMSRGGAPVGGGSAPAAPSSLTATAVSASQINLAWTDNSSDETGFEVERSANGSTGWTNITTTAANATSYSNTGLSASTAYYYRVRAVNSYGNSSYTTTANDTTSASGVFFEADFSLTTYAAFAAQFNDINAYDGGGGASYQAVPAYIDGFNHTGTGSGKRSFRCTYMEDDSGIEVKYGPFPATTSLYIRTREYLAPAGAPSGIATSGNAGWDGNMPAGLKTGRYFTNNNWATDDGSGGWAYQSEKLLYAPEYASGVGSTWNESRGFGSGNYNYDRDGYYVTPWRDPQNLGDWNGYAQYDTPFNISDGNTNPWIKEGQWYLLERWLVLNSSASANGGAGSADGIWIVKINGVTVINFSNMQWLSTSRGCDNGASGWQTAWFCGNYSAGNAYFAYPGQGTPMERYISEMYLSTTADWV